MQRQSIWKKISEIDVPTNCIDRISKKTMIDTAFGTNPRKAELDDVKKLVTISINGAR